MYVSVHGYSSQFRLVPGRQVACGCGLGLCVDPLFAFYATCLLLDRDVCFVSSLLIAILPHGAKTIDDLTQIGSISDPNLVSQTFFGYAQQTLEISVHFNPSGS
jgi:hypothetical protein